MSKKRRIHLVFIVVENRGVIYEMYTVGAVVDIDMTSGEIYQVVVLVERVHGVEG